jgi:peroxiredoxin
MQVGDLLTEPSFQALDVELLSLAPDSAADWRDAAADFEVPEDAILLTDEGNRIATAYDVMQWQAGTGEPGHTFVLVDEDGTIEWIRDYGAPENGGLMWVLPTALVAELEDQLPG